MNKKEFIALAEKYAQDTCTAEEKATVEAFLNRMQDAATILPHLTEGKKEMLLHKIHAQTGGNKRMRFRKAAMRAAAVLVLAMGIGYAFYSLTKKAPMVTVATAKGEKKEIHLKDGSIIVLNANSSLTYPETFGNERRLQLKGEAYFKVHHEEDRPFIVQTHDVAVQVLGTSFNINSYLRQDTKVSVLTGKVQVSDEQGHKAILVQDEQACYNKATGYTYSRESSSDGIAWTKNIIVLKHTTLKETAKILEDWYNIKIDFEDLQTEQLTISGKFKEPNAKNVLEGIAYLKNLKIEYLTSNHIIIRRNTSKK